MAYAHWLILVAGVLGLAAILVGGLAVRFKAPLLLAFLGLGMLAGEDGPGGIRFDDFWAAYLVGSVALAVILFSGGLKSEGAVFRRALAPSGVLATLGVAVTSLIVAAVAALLLGFPWTHALLIGAAVAPTDAAAVLVMIRLSGVKVPQRISAILEVESGLNDPMSVFLALLAIDLMTTSAKPTLGAAALMFLQEMGGGALIGVVAGYVLVSVFRRMSVRVSIHPVLALAVALLVFGGAQALHTSGFLATYLAAIIVGNVGHRRSDQVEAFFDGLAWLAQICLFVMLGLLVTPHRLQTILPAGLAIALVLVFVARPLATALCLAPFRVPVREIAFMSWVGLRGAVPIYLTIMVVLAGADRGEDLFGLAFAVVVISITLQGWTIGPVARWLGLDESAKRDATTLHAPT